jgi:hypothetical protein
MGGDVENTKSNWSHFFDTVYKIERLEGLKYQEHDAGVGLVFLLLYLLALCSA